MRQLEKGIFAVVEEKNWARARRWPTTAAALGVYLVLPDFDGRLKNKRLNTRDGSMLDTVQRVFVLVTTTRRPTRYSASVELSASYF